MNIGIYIPGLGDRYEDESVIKYATRFMNEIDWNHSEAKNVYTLKHETIFLGYNFNKKELNKLRTTKVSIIERKSDTTESVVYSFYDLPYEDVLTDKFKSSPLFKKSLLLLLVIFKKFPRIFAGLFKKKTSGFSQKKRFQSFYAMLLLMLTGIGGILLIPSFFTVFSNIESLPGWASGLFRRYCDNRFWNEVSHYILASSVVLFTTARKLHTLIISSSSKLVCIHYYLQIGERKQAILGHLDHLLEYISEHEDPSASVHIHASDFGAVIGYDLLFPAGTVPSQRVKQKIVSLCTISFPYEFISSYYPLYFSDRNCEMHAVISHWYNVFSIPDFFSTNIKTMNFGESENGVACIMLHNMRYDIVNREKSVFDFIAFFSFKAYKYYWDDSAEGTSCLRLIVRAMIRDSLI